MTQHRIYNFLYGLGLFLLLSLYIFNVFYKISDFPVYSWDEARHGISAYEMLQKKNFFVNTFRYSPDYWNLKPPLSFWAIMAGFKLAGFNTLGFRLLSVIFSIITVILAALYALKKYGKIASLFTVASLGTCQQFLINHSSRTGDADSLFVCLFTIATLSLLTYEKKPVWLYISGVAFSLAFLTKSWHAGNIAIIMALYIFGTRKFKRLTFFNWVNIILSMVLPILAWGIGRYQYDGLKFFQNMIAYDLLQRSSSTLEGHIGGPDYYLLILIRFYSLWLLILCVFLLILVVKYKKWIINVLKRSDILGLCLWILVPLLLFSLAQTKVRWYILPIYPPLSIVIGLIASRILNKEHLIIKVLFMLLVIYTVFFYERAIINFLQDPPKDPKQDLLYKLDRNKSFRGKDIYLEKSTAPFYWEQDIILTAEMYGDLHTKDGGYYTFIKQKGALLLLQRSVFANRVIALHHYRIIASSRWGYIISKR
ncbi:ArnT family glycosyltransferase [Heyndrickxia acidicola]|uniref:Glycosyltransferase family 39 protein n=1 Tax=Heyndrickxia acidicola TaxID=209389 RepID=A0ABU6MED1_9BACI|nr:glycosyltransferase family 39 protein [Heyndrickxia acidicola]MED1202788.1 glycosyltransferase family 39 protein [Heyndrickxia acidicola]